MSDIQFSIIVPCYNSTATLDDLASRVASAMSPEFDPWELLLVNDGSSDATWECIERLSQQHAQVRGFDLMTNVGQFNALVCGIENCRGRFIITMDDDLQHPPEEIPKLIRELESHPELDCVIGRYEVKHHSGLQNAGSWLMARMNEFLHDKPRDLVLSSFRIMRRQLAEAICAHNTARPIPGPVLLQNTRRLGNVLVEHNARSSGKTNYSLLRRIRILTDNFIASTTLPLRFIALCGILAVTISAMMSIYYLIRYFTGQVGVAGFTTLVLLISFFGGLTLLAVGLIGEYLRRIIIELTPRQRYVVRESIAAQNHDDELSSEV